ncbi:unnamed protein product [Blepharisma stoltei]|uniref:EH domain-containing protein n=1 Tax=Blepharisma stoltei TaxID=1481888 RepID=A0AAU9J8Z2_9CILI|nr:unnamed protein product [Blepharisma stoltei]
MNQAFQTGFPQQPQSYQQFYTNPSKGSFPGITKEEIKLYQEGFKNMCGNKGHLSGKEGRDILMKTQLPVPTLRKIWELSDPLATGIMKEEQFIIAMHIIANVRSKGYEVPDALPDSLKRLVYKNEDSSPLSPPPPPPPFKEKPKPEKPPSPKPAPKVIEFTFPSMDQFTVNQPPAPPQPKVQKHSKNSSIRSYEDVPRPEEVSMPKDHMVAEQLEKIIKEKEIMIKNKNDWLANLKDMAEYDKNELDLYKQKNKQLENKIREQEGTHTKMQNELFSAKIKFEDNIKKKDDELTEIKNQLAQLQEINKQLMERKTVSQLKEQYENYAARQESKAEKPKFENKSENIAVEKKVEAFNFNAPNEKFNFSQKDNTNTIESKNENFEFNGKAKFETEVKEIKPIQAAVEDKSIKPGFQFEFSTNERKIEPSALNLPSIEKFDFEVKAPIKENKVMQKQTHIPEPQKTAESPKIKIEPDDFTAFQEIPNKKPDLPNFDFNPQALSFEDKSIMPPNIDKKIEPNSFQFEPPKPALKSEGFGFDFTNAQKIENKITPMFDFNMDITKLENKKPVPAKETSIFDFPKDALVQRATPVIEQPKNDPNPTIEIKNKNNKTAVDQFPQFVSPDKSKDQANIKLPVKNFSFDMPKEIKSDKDSKSSSPSIRSESPESSFKSEPVTSSLFSFDIQKPKETQKINIDPFNISPTRPADQFKFPIDTKELPKPAANEFQYIPEIKIVKNVNYSAKEKELKLDESSSSSSESLEYENEKPDFDFNLKPEDIPQPKMDFGFGNDTPKTNAQPKLEFNFNQAPANNPQSKLEFDFNKDSLKSDFNQPPKISPQPNIGFDFNKDAPKVDFNQFPKDNPQPKVDFNFSKDAPKADFSQTRKDNPQPQMEFNFNKNPPKAELNLAPKENLQPKVDIDYNNAPKADFSLAPKENPQPKMEFDFNKDAPKAPQFDFNKGFAQAPQFDFNKGMPKINSQPKAEFEFGKEISQPKADNSPSFSFEFKPDDIKFDPQFDKLNGQGFDFQSAPIVNAFKGDLFKIETSAIKPRKSPTELEFD